MHKNKKDEATSKKNKNKKDEATSKKNKKNPAAKRKTQQPQQRQAPKSIPREPAGGGGRDAKSSCSWAKAVPNAACCIVPPTDKWEAIQELRARFDKSYERWPPHLTLLFPFLPPGQFRAAAEQLRQDHRFASFHPFTVCLDRLLPPATSRSKYISFHVSESNEGDPLRSTNTKTKATADTSFVPEEEQEEEDLEEEEDCFVPTPKKRSKLGGASGRCPPTRTKPQKQQKKKRKSGTRIQTLSAAPINELPDIFNDVMKALPASQQNYYDIYEVQNLVVASALDIASTASKEQEDAGQSNLHALRRLLLELFPTCDDEKEWRPHVTVGQLPQEQLPEQCQLLQNQWTPLRWEVTELCFLARSQGPESPFTILTTVSLPSASSVASSSSSSS